MFSHIFKDSLTHYATNVDIYLLPFTHAVTAVFSEKTLPVKREITNEYSIDDTLFKFYWHIEAEKICHRVADDIFKCFSSYKKIQI